MQQDIGLDILPPGAADAYEEYLGDVKDSMEHLVREVEKIADILTDHDENTFTKSIQEVLRKLAAQAEMTASSTKEITEGLMGRLEEKNESVGSRRQEEYIDQIRNAALRLEDIEPYKDCELSGSKTFGEEDKEDVKDGLADMTDEWEDAVGGLKEKAERFSEENLQNELSGVYLLLAEQMEGLLQKMAEIVEPVGLHLEARSESVRSRRSEMEQTAADQFSEALEKFRQELEETADNFMSIDF